jgi:hypothetical protein
MANKKPEQSQQLWQACFAEESESAFLSHLGFGGLLAPAVIPACVRLDTRHDESGASEG